jgi:hypothetical protein
MLYVQYRLKWAEMEIERHVNHSRDTNLKSSNILSYQHQVTRAHNFNVLLDVLMYTCKKFVSIICLFHFGFRITITTNFRALTR